MHSSRGVWKSAAAVAEREGGGRASHVGLDVLERVSWSRLAEVGITPMEVRAMAGRGHPGGVHGVLQSVTDTLGDASGLQA